MRASRPQDFIQAFDDFGDLHRRKESQTLADMFDRQCPDLADLRPCRLGKPVGPDLERQRKSRLLRLTRQSDSDDGPGPGVENVVAEDQYGPAACLLMATRRIQLGPANLASQYPGHDAKSASMPTSAKSFSSVASSLAHSAANRTPSSRASFS